MNTKTKGDIGEYSAITKFMKMNWNVLKPIGDRQPYDLVLDFNNRFIKIQIKCAYKRKNSFIINNVRAKTNRKRYKFEGYKVNDFDFAVCYIIEKNEFYVFPVNVFIKFKGKITIGNKNTHEKFKENWDLIEKSPTQ